MEAEKVAVLHEHYRDTCAAMAEHRTKRDRYFYLVLAVLAVAWFDLSAPEGFATALGDILKVQLGLSSSPDLGYVRNLLWFVLLGLTIRYGQAALGVERLYIYLHELESVLSVQVDGAFRREGQAYEAYNPFFLSWAHYLYTLFFPMLLAVVAVSWMWRQIPSWPWPFSSVPWSFGVWFNMTITVAILASIGMYLHAFHFYNRRRETKKPVVQPRRKSR
jgi:hypothetical protein